MTPEQKTNLRKSAELAELVDLVEPATILYLLSRDRRLEALEAALDETDDNHYSGFAAKNIRARAAELEAQSPPAPTGQSENGSP